MFEFPTVRPGFALGKTENIRSRTGETKLLPNHSITVCPTMENMETVLAFIENTLTDLGVPPKDMVKINIAADEIFSNIVRYSGASEAKAECGAADGQVWLVFTDNGRPYDPTEKPDPDTAASADGREAGGMGIFIVKKMMDHVQYDCRGGKNILTLAKRLDETIT